MRRAREREMEANQTHCAENGLPTKFVTKFMEIPVVKLGYEQAQGVYGRVKDFNSITSKSFELAESVTGKVVSSVTPLAQRTLCISGIEPSLQKIDNFATSGLESLETKLPSMTKDPVVLMSSAKNTAEEAVAGIKNRVWQVSEVVLLSKPAQTYFDLLDYMLSKANTSLDAVLPPDVNKEGQNGSIVEDLTPKDRAKRGLYILQKFWGLLGTAKARVIYKVRSRIETTSNAADAVFKEAKKAVNHALPIAADKDLSTASSTNGDSNKATAPTKNKKKAKEHGHENN